MDHDERCDGGEGRRKRGIRLEIRRKLLPEESGRDDHLIGAAETMEDEVAEAAADRIANQERAGEHGDRRGNAGDHGKVGTPVIGAPNDEARKVICRSSVRLSRTNRTRRAVRLRRRDEPADARLATRDTRAVSNYQFFCPTMIEH